MPIKYDCKFFKGNVPCQFHKDQKIVCDACAHYSSKSKKLLIIKLLAMGDVLRTTFMLEPIKKRFKDICIVWLTHPDARQLLINNELVDEILEYNLDTLSQLLVERFDVVFNPSNDKVSSILATLAIAKKKFGFIYNERGFIQPQGSMAEYYLKMGTDDLAKKTNQLTYQQIVSGMLGVECGGSKSILRLTDEELAFGEKFRERHNLRGRLVVGLNTGAGERWQLKKLSVEKTIELASRLNKDLNAKVILFGGPEEQDRNREIMEGSSGVLIDAGCNNSLREFASLINLADILVTSDTLGMHIAAALDKYVIALFGPTSYAEVELYDRGKKIYPEGIDCLTCYKNTCSKRPNCMDSINVDDILTAIKEFLKGHD